MPSRYSEVKISNYKFHLILDNVIIFIYFSNITGVNTLCLFNNYTYEYEYLVV